MLTGKTIGELVYLETPTADTLIPVELSGYTYHIDFSAITGNGGGVIETTYSELQDMVNGGGLIAGTYYTITDFRTCYDQPDYDYNRAPITGDNYKEGPIEPIIVFATSANTLSTTAYQPAYPNDRIQYDVYFSQTERTSGAAYGRITERIDEFNNRTDYDHRTILFKRYRYYEINFDNPYQGTVQVSSVSPTEMVVSGTGTNFLSISLNTKVGFDTTSNDYKVYEITNVVSDTEMTITGFTSISLSSGSKMFFADWDEYSSYYQNNVDDPSLFQEYYTFDGTDNFNNYIGNHANLYQWNENDFILANNVFHTRFIGNKFGDECYNNTFFDDCENNVVGNYFYNNITDDDFDGNLIGNYFYNNRTTSNFQYNRIGENFNNNYIVQNSFYRNNIGNGFEYNQISGDDFQNNEIGNQFNNNKLRNGQFYKNDIGNGYNNNIIYWNFYGNLVGNGFASNELYCPFYDNVIGDYYNNNNFGDINNPNSNEFYENRIGYNFYNNSITAITNNNIIGNDFENNTILGTFVDNKIGNQFKGNLMFNEFSLNDVKSYISSNQFSGYTRGNSIGDYTFDNDFLGEVNGNSWKGDFYANTIGDSFNNNSFYYGVSNNIIGNNFYSNDIQNYFNNNTIGNGFQTNQIANNFNNNTVGDNFGYGYTLPQGNKIGSNFYNNNVGEYFYNNSIADNFINNTIGNYFQWNIINTNIDTTNFTFNYGNITGFSYTATGTSAADNLYMGIQICGATQSEGVGATFDVEVSGNLVVGVSGATEGRLYQVDDVLTILGTQIGGVTGVIDTFSSDAIGKSGTTGVYNSVSAEGGSGNNASFNITVVDNLITIFTLAGDGEGYSVNDELTILGSQFGGVDGTDDITITIDTIYSDDVVITVTGVTSGSLFYDQYTKEIFERKGGNKRVSYYDEEDVLNVDSIYLASGYIPVYSQLLTFPINYTSFEFWCDGGYTNSGGLTNQTVTNMTELVTYFNSYFRSFGFFFDNYDGTLGLYINPSLKQQYCPNGTYSIYVFND